MSISIYLYCDVDTGGDELYTIELFNGNCTHNLSDMWRRAGCFDAIYNSDGKRAKDIIPDLEKGLDHMQRNAQIYVPMNPDNGWGSYSDGLMYFLGPLTDACRRHPNATITVSK